MALKRAVISALVRQGGHPRGIAGSITGWVMGHRSSNRQRNSWVVSLLDVQPTERVLEIGFGPGLAIAELSRRIGPAGHVYGIDHSEVMLRQATRRNAAAIQAGRVTLTLGTVEQLPPALDGPFNVILAVNSLGFWPAPAERLADFAGDSRHVDESPSSPNPAAREPRGAPRSMPPTGSQICSRPPASPRREPKSSTSTLPSSASSPSTPPPLATAALQPHSEARATK